MKHLPITIAALLGSLLFHVSESVAEKPIPDLTPEEAAAIDRAAESAVRGFQLHSDRDFDGAEVQYIKSLRDLPLHSKTEHLRMSYQKQLELVLKRVRVAPKRDEEYVPRGDVEDKIPFLGFQYGPPALSKKIILPKVDFSAISLIEALTYLEQQSREIDPDPQKAAHGMKIRLDAPSTVANTPITLHLTNVPLSEAILRTAELASCRVYHSYQVVTISCVDMRHFVDLRPLKIDETSFSLSAAAGKWHNDFWKSQYSNSTAAAPTGKWLTAFWKLQSAESAASEGNRPKARYYYREALNLYEALSKDHPEFHAEMVRARMKDLTEILERK